MDFNYHMLMVKEASLGRAFTGALGLAARKPANLLRQGANKIGLGSGKGAQQYADDLASNQKLWGNLHKQQDGVGAASRFMSGANKVRKNPWVLGGAIGGSFVAPDNPFVQAASWATMPGFSAAFAGANAMQGARANTDYWKNKVEEQARQGAATAGQEAMTMIGQGYTGKNYQQMINQYANQNNMGNWMQTLNNPSMMQKQPSVMWDIISGQGDRMVQNQISRRILNEQKGIY